MRTAEHQHLIVVLITARREASLTQQELKARQAPRRQGSPTQQKLKVRKATRRQSSLTQRELAARLNWPYAVIARVESGERRLDVIEFGQYARALGVNPEVLYSRVISGISPVVNQMRSLEPGA